MQSPLNSGRTVRTTKWTRVLVASIVVLLSAAVVTGWRGAGRWLVREDPLANAGAVVVLSGSIPARAQEAARIVHLGYAPEVWVSRPQDPAAELQQLGIHFVGEEEYNREILAREGVATDAIHILPETIVDTEQEVEVIVRQMQQSGKSRVIIVTSPPHTRRVKTLWAALAPKDRQAIVRAAYEDEFDADHWWRNTRDSYAVTREILGLMNAWAGLPIRPHSDLAEAAPAFSK